MRAAHRFVVRAAALAACAVVTLAEAQPAGMIDPLYEHRCNVVVDPALAKAGKGALREKLIQLDGLYKRSIVLAQSGDPQAALQQLLTFQKAMAAILAPTHHVYVDALLRGVALRSELRDFEDAMRDAEAAVRTREGCLGPGNPFTLEAMSVMARLQERMGLFPTSLKLSQEILGRQRRRLEGMNPVDAAAPTEQKRLLVASANVAALAYRTRDFERAKLGAAATVEVADKLPADDLERYELLNSAWYILDRIAFFGKDAQSQLSAIEGLEQSYQAMRARLGQEHPRTLPLLSNLGFAVADVDAKRAVPILGDYVAMVEAQRLRSPLPGDRRVLLESRANVYQRFAFAAHEAQRTEEAFWGMEWSKSRALRDDLSIKLALADKSLTSEDRAALAASESRIAQLEAAVEAVQADPPKRDAARQALLNEKQAYERTFSAAEARNPALRLASLSKIQRPDNAKELLKLDEVYLGYLTRRVDGPIFEVLIAVLEPTGRLTLAGPVTVLGLENSVSSFAQILSTAGGLDAVAQAGKDLFRVGDAFFIDDANKTYPQAKKIVTIDPLRVTLSNTLLPDAVRDIVARYRRWIISPGGALWNVPFEALSDGKGLVVDERIVRYAHSWSMLTLLNARSKARDQAPPTELLAIGGATYADRVLPRGVPNEAFPKWGDLTYSDKELLRVAKTYGLVEGRSLFRGANATRQTIATLQSSGELARARMVLMSAHGYLNLANPALSAVVLGRPTDGTEVDRYLSAHDIARLSLNADVVVVSSCESGRGRLAAGEGVLGLPYAFFSAGALSTVLTVWKIYDDAATANLVDQFMDGMRRGLPTDEALTLAKRTIRRSADEANWAPFMLLGR
ncbi:MAG: CHAT domain-containing protein [Rubrivivax sp.]|nr:CHAT domain-containing protein [Rubrivivax sp.]